MNNFFRNLALASGMAGVALFAPIGAADVAAGEDKCYFCRDYAPGTCPPVLDPHEEGWLNTTCWDANGNCGGPNCNVVE